MARWVDSCSSIPVPTWSKERPNAYPLSSDIHMNAVPCIVPLTPLLSHTNK